MATFDFRRKLSRHEELQALGAAVGLGAVALYLTRIWTARTPIRDAAPPVVFHDGLVRAEPERSAFAAPGRRAP